MKIQIIGFTGSGKSTLAKKFGELYNIPVLHLDSTKFYGDWQERTEEEQSQIVEKFLSENESWVIDGNYSKICPKRFEMSDMTIYLNFNRFKCFFSAYNRYKQNKNTLREDLGVKDKFDKSFAIWILFVGRKKKIKKQNLENLNKTSGKKYIFKNRKQIQKFLDSLDTQDKK